MGKLEQLRMNTFDTRVALNGAKQDLPVKCRKCRNAAESLEHIPRACPNLHSYVIRRHNNILEIVTEAIERKCGVDIMKEQGFIFNDERLKPDLIFCLSNTG